MKAEKAIKQIIKKTGFTQKRLAEVLGYPHQSNIAEKLRCKNMYVAAVVELLDVMGYELVIQPKKRGRRPDGQILITRGDEE